MFEVRRLSSLVNEKEFENYNSKSPKKQETNQHQIAAK